MAPPDLRLDNISEPLIQVEDAAALEEEPEGEIWSVKGVERETYRLIRLAVPLSLQYTFAYTTLLVASAFCGHLGKFELSVAVLSTSVYNVLGASILVGVSSAIETLCGMAYGAKNYNKMGVLLQRAIIVVTAVFMLICMVWSAMGPILRLAGQEPILARESSRYLHLSIPALFFGGINSLLQRYLQSQGIVFPVTVAVGGIAVLAPFYMYFFIYSLKLGLYGAAIGTGANNFSIAVALVSITVWRERSLRGTEKQMWHGWSRRAWKGLATYLSLAVPSTGMICLEWWSFEVVVLMAGLLKEPELAVAVMGVTMSLNALVYMIPRGMSGAASTRVSNELGAGHPSIAKRAAWMAVLLGGGSAGLLGIAAYLFRHTLIQIFTTDPDVIDADMKIFPIMCYSVLTDGINVSIEGVVRGSGRQALAASVNALSYWVIGIPTAWAFGFPLGLRVAGFWWSRALATTVQALIMLIVLLWYDWEGLSKLAVVSIAAATPRVAETAQEHKSHPAFSRTPEEVAALAASQQMAASGQLPPLSMAISIRRQQQEQASDSDGEGLARTPQYSFTSHVTQGGGFGNR